MINTSLDIHVAGQKIPKQSTTPIYVGVVLDNLMSTERNSIRKAVTRSFWARTNMTIVWPHTRSLNENFIRFIWVTNFVDLSNLLRYWTMLGPGPSIEFQSMNSLTKVITKWILRNSWIVNFILFVWWIFKKISQNFKRDSI